MAKILKQKPQLLRHFLRGNMVLGSMMFVLAIYFTVTGQYESLALRQQTEGILNMIAISSLLYAVLFWYLDIFSLSYLTIKNSKGN